MRKLILMIRNWKLFLGLFLLMLLVGLGYTCYYFAQQNISNHKTAKKIEQEYSNQYGMEIEFEEELFFADVKKKYAIQGEYLSKMLHQSSGIDYYLVRRKGTSPTTEFLCVRNNDGQIIDSYPYDKMIELADACGLSSYLRPNTYLDASYAYTQEDYMNYFGPVFVARTIQGQSEDFYSKWDTYIQNLREEETIWRGREDIYVLFDGEISTTYKYKISHVIDEKSDQKQVKKLKKWVEKPHE